MASKKLVKVPLFGQINRTAMIEQGATQGAQIGVDLKMPDGTIATLAILAAALGVSSSSSSSGSGVGPISRTLWSLIGEIPANVVEVAALTTSGLVVRQADGDWITRSIAVGSVNRLTITDGDGDAGAPTIDMADILALSVWGRATNSAGKPAEIPAGTDDRVLRQTGSVLNFGQLTAGMFTAAVVPDSALSTNVAFLDAATHPTQSFTNDNTFSGKVTITKNSGTAVYPLFLQAAAPRIVMDTTGGGLNARVWDFALGVTANHLLGRVRNTADNAGSTWLDVTRSTTNISSIALTCGTVTTFTLNGSGFAVTAGSGVISAAINVLGITCTGVGTGTPISISVTNNQTVDLSEADIVANTTSGTIQYRMIEAASSAPVTNGVTGLQAILQVGNFPLTFAVNGVSKGRLTATEWKLQQPLNLASYTVATLPGSPQDGWVAFVTDALAPVALAAVVGGGTVHVPVYYSSAASAWMVG